MFSAIFVHVVNAVSFLMFLPLQKLIPYDINIVFNFSVADVVILRFKSPAPFFCCLFQRVGLVTASQSARS